MRAILQRVKKASVSVEGKEISSFNGAGIMALVGVTQNDGDDEIDFIVRKIANLRIMRDEKSISDLHLPIMIVSQFTLYGDCKKGRRPTWIKAAKGEIAKPIIDKIVARLKDLGLEVYEGKFGADMQVSIINDGPFTICLLYTSPSPRD